MSGFIDNDHAMSLLAQRQATIEELTKKLAQAENKLDRAIVALRKSEERHAERDLESIDPQVWDHLAAFNEGYTAGRRASEAVRRGVAERSEEGAVSRPTQCAYCQGDPGALSCRDVEDGEWTCKARLALYDEGYTAGRRAMEASKEGMDRAEGLSEDARQAAHWLLAQGMELFIARRLQEDMNTRAKLEARVKELELEAAYWHKEYVAANTGERCASLEEEFRAKSAKGEP